MPFRRLISAHRDRARRPRESLDRFVAAQQQVYPRVLAELRAGEKRSHWMWFIFPQIAGLGSRLADCTDTMLGWAGRRSAEAILGPVDALKFCSSMTLFDAADGGARYARALDGFCKGERDGLTLTKLAAQAVR